MDRKLVESSNIVSVGYAAKAQVLEVEFKHGGVYRFVGVPVGAYNDLMAAKSVGKQFARAIRGRYPFIEVSNGQAQS